jgi:ComF family protein
MSHSPGYDRTISAWQYSHPVDRLILALKFHGRLALAPFFAKALAGHVGVVDLVIPMPLHRSRLAERGYNQAAEMARVLAQMTNTTLLLRGAERTRATPSQTGLATDERRRNVRGAFACMQDLAGARVAVVDDVMTTGATLDELAKVLKRAGAVHVENWVVARTII